MHASFFGGYRSGQSLDMSLIRWHVNTPNGANPVNVFKFYINVATAAY